MKTHVFFYFPFLERNCADLRPKSPLWREIQQWKHQEKESCKFLKKKKKFLPLSNFLWFWGISLLFLFFEKSHQKLKVVFGILFFCLQDKTVVLG
jgi:hypothetical protein